MKSFGNLFVILTFVAALGCGLIAGVFFAFSGFVMKALARVSPPQGIAAMQSINITVINPVFLGIFLGSGMACMILAIYSIFRWPLSGSSLLLLGCVLYLVGTLLVTFVFNVPMNNVLAAADPTKPDGVEIWRRYVDGWTLWNHVRTIAALAASAALFLSLVRRAAQI